MAIRCTAVDTPPAAWLAAVDAGLDEHNRNAAPGLAAVRELASFAHDGQGRLVGGAVGRTWGRCCELLQLWVDAPSRRGGIGAQLLRAFEDAARQRGCTVFYLTTWSFQAPDFYRRHGYTVLAEIAGHEEGTRQFLMHKVEAGGG